MLALSFSAHPKPHRLWQGWELPKRRAQSPSPPPQGLHEGVCGSWYVTGGNLQGTSGLISP